MNRGRALRLMETRLRPLLGEFSQSEAEIALMTLLNISRTELLLSLDKDLDSELQNQIETIINRRLQHEPLQYILGKAYFYDREFIVTPDVLIPRPDTEVIIEKILSDQKCKKCCFADLGTGSGIIAATLKNQKPQWRAFAVDISPRALKVARQNTASKVNLLCADMVSSFKRMDFFDFIISNPPYISAGEIKTLDKSVVEFEPYGALYGGEDGLHFYRLLASEAPYYLVQGGYLYLEIGYNQGQAVTEILSDEGWDEIILTKDLQGHPRVISAKHGK
ncbi:Protein-N(5)-glutamine methyltransferase PrmC [Chitinispirillum alkaliphilum]|nr:Protein-N(5)-glutamine methyltransferase PrmC [Chitinispirillum alkaliphilum]